MLRNKLKMWLWDAWCVFSIVGIWPRYIEPKLLATTKLKLPISHLPSDLNGIKILHFSDLHWKLGFTTSLLKKMICQINALEPDFILFTGDFLCRSTLEDAQGLKHFLCALKAKIGQFAILGNHDYAKSSAINAQGDYDVDVAPPSSDVEKGFKRLFSSIKLSKEITPEAKNVGLHQDLISLLQGTPMQLLHNSSQLVACGQSFINICGIGEYTLGHSNVVQAFKHYNRSYPGIVMAHNPDALTLLEQCPGQLVLAGHTHGGQVNLPFIWKKFTYLENQNWKRGLKKLGNKWVYINRGISSTMNFRLFSMPELSLITLYGK
jgi:predicted MPP superfamily phosphohydrolase